jgi:hypothetical protein
VLVEDGDAGARVDVETEGLGRCDRTTMYRRCRRRRRRWRRRWRRWTSGPGRHRQHLAHARRLRGSRRARRERPVFVGGRRAAPPAAGADPGRCQQGNGVGEGVALLGIDRQHALDLGLTVGERDAQAVAAERLDVEVEMIRSVAQQQLGRQPPRQCGGQRVRGGTA